MCANISSFYANFNNGCLVAASVLIAQLFGVFNSLLLKLQLHL